ncbi:hypothetical protein [Salmonirosea aquatica]|uniref:Lipoprotein n=1 Tax=Salmonirosea aquatica TaxID=2654236 RepID=A0A7C9BFK6_9BACT|nr:hypothetical protein [Cytophagaceae bacterium SJW1-29]
MKYSTSLRYLLWVCLLGAITTGCRTKTTTDEEATAPTDSAVIHDPASSAINSNQSELFNTIVGTSDEGVIRGIAFGDPVSKVKATESFEMFEDSLRHVGFTFETDQLETIDVLYYFTPTGRTINKITVDIYLNSETATRQLWSSAEKRFTEKYGTPLEAKPRRIVWQKNPVKTSMEEVSEGKDYGLKLVFEPTDKAMLASK